MFYITQTTIVRLAVNSDQVAQLIENSSLLQGDIMRKQSETLKNQESLLEWENVLQEILKRILVRC